MDLCQQSDIEMYLKLTAGVLIAAGTTGHRGENSRSPWAGVGVLGGSGEVGFHTPVEDTGA